MRDVTVSGLGKTFGAQPVLTGLDLDVPAGSLTAILGPSGSGKTTLLRLLAGFERADTGTIGIGGVLVDGPGAYLPPERRRIGYVPQEGSLFPHLTVAGNVGFGLPAGQRRGGKVDGLLETELGIVAQLLRDAEPVLGQPRSDATRHSGQPAAKCLKSTGRQAPATAQCPAFSAADVPSVPSERETARMR